MKHEKIIKRDDGFKFKIISRLSDVGFMEPLKWGFEVEVCAPKKRTWANVIDRNRYSYRGMDTAEKTVFNQSEKLKWVTKEEVLEAQMELWELLKPIKL